MTPEEFSALPPSEQQAILDVAQATRRRNQFPPDAGLSEEEQARDEAPGRTLLGTHEERIRRSQATGQGPHLWGGLYSGLSDAPDYVDWAASDRHDQGGVDRTGLDEVAEEEDLDAEMMGAGRDDMSRDFDMPDTRRRLPRPESWGGPAGAPELSPEELREYRRTLEPRRPPPPRPESWGGEAGAPDLSPEQLEEFRRTRRRAPTSTERSMEDLIDAWGAPGGYDVNPDTGGMSLRRSTAAPTAENLNRNQEAILDAAKEAGELERTPGAEPEARRRPTLEQDVRSRQASRADTTRDARMALAELERRSRFRNQWSLGNAADRALEEALA